MTDSCPTTLTYTTNRGPGATRLTGKYTATVVANDGTGTSSCVVQIHVLEYIPPAITNCRNQTVGASSTCTATGSFATSDNCPGTTVRYSPTTAGLGTTAMTATPIDRSGNEGMRRKKIREK